MTPTELKARRIVLDEIEKAANARIAEAAEERREIDRKIAEAEKPVERLPVGSSVYLKMLITAFGSQPNLYWVGGHGLSICLRESDLVAIPVFPSPQFEQADLSQGVVCDHGPAPLTAERIEAALREMRFRSAGVGDVGEWMLLTDFAAALAERLGAAPDAEKGRQT